MNTPKNYENEKYWVWIRENFPGEEAEVKELWQKLAALRVKVADIENQLLKYAPPKETK